MIICQGLPASGKSTWSKQYCIDHPQFIRVNKDDIREFFTGIPYSTQFEEYIINIERLYVDAIINQKKSIIIDDSNFNPRYMNYWMQKAHNEGLEVEIKTFDTSLEECISRDSKREKSVGKAVILEMYEKYIKQK